MILTERIVIYTIQHPNPIQIVIDLPAPSLRIHVEEYLRRTYCELLPKKGWVPRVRIRHVGCETQFELFDQVWLLL